MPRDRKSKESIRATLTERQQFWLKHLEVADQRGESIQDYASRKKLSVHSLYSARKRLGQLGIAPVKRVCRTRATFDQVKVVPEPVSASVAWRVRFPSGAVLESSAPLSGEAGLELIKAIAHIS